MQETEVIENHRKSESVHFMSEIIPNNYEVNQTENYRLS